MKLMEQVQSLELALAGFEKLRTPARITAELRREGVAALSHAYEGLATQQRDDVTRKAFEMSRDEIGVVIFGEPDFPDSLIQGGRPLAPVVFYKGNKSLLYAPSVGMCGSRHVSAEGLEAAVKSGETVTRMGLAVISGYAQGVDTATHLAALRTGGNTAIVLAEGFDHFRIKRDFAKDFDPDRTLILSQFSPGQPWQAHAAMSRNALIFGLSKALLVIEAGERGGTLAAGEGALELGRPVLVIDFGDRTPEGNRRLLAKGAYPVRTSNELSGVLGSLPIPREIDEIDPPSLF